jgi:hypothetical protein
VKTAAAGAALALVAAIAFWPVVSGDRSFFQLDLRYEHVPIWDAVQKALLSGESPFWIDGQYCGNPLLFHQEAPIFYPLTVPLLATGAPAHRAADLFALFHFWLAGFAAFLFARELTGDPPTSLFGGVAWMLSARMVQNAIWPNAVAVAALLPLLLLGILRIGARRRWGIATAAVSGGLCLLAARPHVVVGALPLLVAFVAPVLVISPRRAAAMRDLAVAELIALALGAPSVVPTAVLRPETSRARALPTATRDLFALASGGDLDQVFLPVDGPARWPEAAAYPGVLVGAFVVAGALFALRRREEFPRVLFGGLLAGGVIGLVFAFGEKGPLRFIADLPLVSGFRVPARYLTSWSLALAIGSTLVLAAIARSTRRPSIVAGVAALVLTVDLTLHARAASPTAPSEIYSIEPDLARQLRPRLAKDEAGFPRRVWSLSPAPFLWILDDREKLAFVRQSEPLYGALGMTFGFEMVGGAGPSPARWKALFLGVDERKAALAGAGAVVVPGDGTLEVRQFAALPRAIVVPEAVEVASGDAIRAVLDPGLDPRVTAVLEEGSGASRLTGWHEGAASVRLVERGPGRLRLAAELPAEGILVVFNSYEKGWRATVDGEARPVLVADAAFQGVRLSRGRHDVELSYHGRGVAAGFALAALGIAGLVLLSAKGSA